MSTNEQAPSVPHPFMCRLMALVLVGAPVLAGCDSDDTTAPGGQVARIAISPDTASIAVGTRLDFSAVALTASGDTVRTATLDFRWESTDTAVFTVEDDGTAIGRTPGRAFCTIAVTNLPAFTGRDSAFVSVF